MRLVFPNNPFRDMAPGGSPSARWSRPPMIQLGDRHFLAVFYWDTALMKSNQSKETFHHLADTCNVGGQSIVRAPDGEEFYARILATGQVDLANTGFFGTPFEPPTQETEMTILEKYKEHIAAVYADQPEAVEQVKEGLADCPTFATVQTYLATFWDKKSISHLVEEFFTTDV